MLNVLETEAKHELDCIGRRTFHKLLLTGFVCFEPAQFLPHWILSDGAAGAVSVMTLFIRIKATFT
jgi:hypothetical protein